MNRREKLMKMALELIRKGAEDYMDDTDTYACGVCDMVEEALKALASEVEEDE